jgi:L-alanine-DL-glutamate epimerase-like enolase superfamily enzyme
LVIEPSPFLRQNTSAMGKPTDIRTVGAALYFLPVRTRVPLKFGNETLTHITCARARVTVTDAAGRTAEGWGETPLSVQWVWPGGTPYEERHEALKTFCVKLTGSWACLAPAGHPIELGHDFQETVLPGLWHDFNRRHRDGREPMPWLAALLCCSPFDLAVHDAYGRRHARPTYTTYNATFMNHDLAHFLEPSPRERVSFARTYPADFLAPNPPQRLVAWHLVGGLDALDASELTGAEPQDGYPVTLTEWIQRDGLKCLKVKLRGDDAAWDFQRLAKVAAIGAAHGVEWLSADFNCTVRDPAYVNAVLDRLRDEQPRAFDMIRYVEQPFPYELEPLALDVRSVSARKPLFLDESAHDWKRVRLGRDLGWTGVALKTCKTQTGALLTACWARAHGMQLMVQDLTNPMLAQIPHVLLAAHVGTILGVETNAMQFYPEASRPEARVHPGLYQRRHGVVDLSTVGGPGLGYRQAERQRDLPPPACVAP